MSIPIHHLHKRKRIHQKQEKYPSPHTPTFVLDHAIYIIGIMAPLSGSAQSYKIWTEKNASGVSLLMFGTLLVFNLVWLYYGFVHKEKPIILMYILWILVNTSIVVGTLLYA